MNERPTRPCVLVFAGLDPSGGAGIHADIAAISAMGAHALPVVTTLTVQDNDHVYAVHPVDADIVRHQVQSLTAKITVAAIKIGIIGDSMIASVITETIRALRTTNPLLPVVLDPVLASGHGDVLSREDAAHLLASLRPLATLITPNAPEAMALSAGLKDKDAQAVHLMRDTPHVLIKGGHDATDSVTNHWFSGQEKKSWQWPRLPGAFHGSGCTLASACAAALASGMTMQQALERAQQYVQRSLTTAYAIADGQLIPQR